MDQQQLWLMQSFGRSFDFGFVQKPYLAPHAICSAKLECWHHQLENFKEEQSFLFSRTLAYFQGIGCRDCEQR